MTDKPFAAIAAIAAMLAPLPLAIACGPITERPYETEPWTAEGLEPREDPDNGPAPETPPAELGGSPETAPAPTDLETPPPESLQLLRGALDGTFGPLGAVSDEAIVSQRAWFGAERVMLEVWTDDETASRAIVAVGNLDVLLALEPTDGPVPLTGIASVWICSEGQDETGADWSWDQPSTEGTVEILEVEPGVYEYRFDVQGTSDGGRFGRASVRASFLQAR